ncbi:outer spore coat protein CotE [bacterium]|nr:outer spore coat protein CotE [bacterium]MBQ4584501.1 outer spore coat protein CotE [Bacilli bacterium]
MTHTFNGQNNNGSVVLNGSFDINVWYSYDNDTKTSVSTQRFNYSDQMNVRLKDNANLTNASEIIVRSLKQPTVTDVKIADGLVNLNVEKELGVEIVGDTKLKVSVEEDEDEYEVIEEYVAENDVDENIDDIDENFLD